MHRTPDDHALDRALGAWANRPEALEARVDAVIAGALGELDRASAPATRRWLTPVAGMALAAGIALGVVLLPGSPAPVAPSAPVEVASVAPIAETHAEAFELLFTPTPEEEEYL